jgi:hypothetical protein
MAEAQQLKSIAHHISYEIEMFELSAEKLKRGGLNQFEINSFLEVFNLHTRNLLDFLFPPFNLQLDDVLAQHFFTDSDAFQKRLPELVDREKIRKRIAKEMAHLTYKRIGISLEDKQWDYGKIQQEVNQVLVVFFRLLSEEQRSWFYFVV